MGSSDLTLRIVALAVALAVFVVVRGDRQVTVAFTVPLVARIPESLSATPPLPADVSVSVSGAWARLRTVDAGDLGAATLDLGRAGPGVVAWTVRPETIHVPRGLHVDSIYPSQGTVELRHAADPATPAATP